MTRAFSLLPELVKVYIGKFIILLLIPLKKHPVVHKTYKRIKHAIGWHRVIKKGDIVIQGGVDYTFPPSFVEPMSRAVGKKGLVIAIEPSMDNINIVHKKIKEKRLSKNITLVNKALSDRKGKISMVFGKKGTWNRLDDLSDKSWKHDEEYSGYEEMVEVDTIDNIIEALKLNPQKIRFVSLTINGQEYKALKGMKDLLSKSRNLSINVVAGRDKANPEIGIINGKADYKVISDLLENHGFKTKYFELQKNKMGYVMGVKGNNKFFMS